VFNFLQNFGINEVLKQQVSPKLQLFPNANVEFFATTETIFFHLKQCNMVMFRNPSTFRQYLAIA